MLCDPLFGPKTPGLGSVCRADPLPLGSNLMKAAASQPALADGWCRLKPDVLATYLYINIWLIFGSVVWATKRFCCRFQRTSLIGSVNVVCLGQTLTAATLRADVAVLGTSMHDMNMA